VNKIWVIGLGPGHPDYMLPIAKNKLLSADRIYGGKRHLDSYEMKGQKIQLKMPLIDTINDMKENFENQQVAVLVSGDTGFYSFLEMIKGHFEDHQIETFPGISSLQYMFSKLNMSYHDAYIGSVHGRQVSEEIFNNYNKIGLLTDRHQNPNQIIERLIDLKISAKLYVGENLSYEDEEITIIHTDKPMERTYSSLCVVVIELD